MPLNSMQMLGDLCEGVLFCIDEVKNPRFLFHVKKAMDGWMVAVPLGWTTKGTSMKGMLKRFAGRVHRGRYIMIIIHLYVFLGEYHIELPHCL